MIASRKHKLTARQLVFCREYFVCNNVTQAAIKAGYTPKNADKNGYLLLGYPWVLAEISRLRKLAEDESICTVKEADGILSEMLRAKQSDYTELLPDGEEVHSYTKDSKNQHGVKTVLRRMYSTGSGDGKQDVVVAGVELHDKPRCLDIFYKRFNAYPKDRAVTEVYEALKSANGINFNVKMAEEKKT